MRVLVTGCAGFIGSKVSEMLLEAGHEVVGADDLNPSYDPRLKEHRLRGLTPHKAFTFHRASVARIAELRPLFRDGRFDAVMNLAARAGVRQSLLDPWLYVETNVVGTLNLLDLCREHDVRRFLLASTSSLYGMQNERPFKETSDTDRPQSPYAATKKGAEALTASYAHLYGLDTPVVRYFTVYGPAGRPDMSMFRFVRWIAEGEPIVMYGDGSQRRDFTYVDDIARGTILASERVKGFDVLNLGSDRPITLRHMIEVVERHLGRAATIDRRPAHRADVLETWADNTKARTTLGWEPRVDFEAGVRASVEWYLEHREAARAFDLGAT